MTPSAADEILLRRTLDFERRQEKFAALLVQHDEELAKLAEVLPAWKDSFLSRLPEITDKFERVIPALIAEEIGKAKVGISAEQARAAGEAAFALGKARDELFAMVRELDAKLGGEMAKVKTPAEISAELEQIADRVSLENARRLFAEKGAELEANWKAQLEARKPERVEFATPPVLADAFRGNWKQGVTSAARGDVWQWFGSTFVALENTSETPNKSQAMRGNGAWGLLASSGAGGGGGGGGDSLPSQTGNAGKFLKTDGTSTLWEAIPGGGDMLGANNLTDVASVTAAFANIKQAATTTASGVVTLATSGESAALKAVQANDARLSDSRTPTAHASTHQTGGSDPIDFPVDSVFGATNTITQVDYLAVNTSSTVAVTTAKAVWNATESTLELGFNSSTSTMLGMDLHAQIYNQSGSPFTKGQVIKADGSSGTRLKGSLALATSDANSAQTLGVCSQTISNNGSGVIIAQGVLRGIDTNSFNEGDTLWLSATTAGAMTNVRPTAPNHGVRIGYVVKKAGVADGIIFVDVLNGVELDELHDVSITGLANNDFLAYNSSITAWRNRQLFDSTAPAALAASATAGVSITAARVDHVHARPTFDQLTISGEAQGDILYRSAASWERLPAATAGYILQTNGSGANPSWAQNTGGSGAPTDADYLVKTANGSLSAERVVTDSTSITVNWATAGQVSWERAALTGDVTASQNSNATTIANDAVGNAKLANMTASTIKARVTASTGDPEDASLTQVLDLIGSVTYGDILYRDSTSWARLPAGTSGHYLKTQGAGAAPTWSAVSSGGGGGTKTYSVFTPLSNQPPAVSFATLDTRNSVAVLDFDDGATNEIAVFLGVMPEAASVDSGLKVRIHWAATSATSGNVKWAAQFERLVTDIDSDSFDTAVSVTTTTNGTSGVPNITEISTTYIDSVTGGDGFRLKIYRDSADTTNDTMTGDAELVVVEVRSAG